MALTQGNSEPDHGVSSLTGPCHGDGSDSLTNSYSVSAELDRALANDHILDLILSLCNLPNSKSASARNQDLLSASLVSKRYFNLAVKHLWHSLDSWVPLVKVIGCVEEGEKGILTTNDAIFPNHLVRYNFYAKLVKRLELSFNAKRPRTQVSGHIVPSVSQYEQAGSLLPSLETLIITDFQGVTPEDMAFLFALVPFATLSSLVIKGINPNMGILVTSLLQNVRLKSPTLGSITLEGNCHLSIFQSMEKFTVIRRINLDFRDMDLLVCHKVFRTKYVTLESLRIVGTVHTIKYLMDDVFHDTPGLQNVHLSIVPEKSVNSGPVQCTHLNSVVQSITNRKSLSLRSIIIISHTYNIHIQLPRSTELCQQLFHYFDFPSCDQLRVLTIPLDILCSHPLPASMRRLKMLEHLSITAGVKEAYRYSPKEPSLIPPEGGPRKKTPLPLSSIAIFLEACPNLKSLTIPISLNTTSVQIKQMQTDLKLPFKCHTLQRLALAAFVSPGRPNALFNVKHEYEYEYPSEFHPTTKFSELFLLSRYLNHLFPHLHEVDTQELRPFVDNGWLDGLESGVKEFREMKISNGDRHVCRQGKMDMS